MPAGLLDAWLARLAAHAPGEEPPLAGPQAAVAALVRATSAGPELLLMQRVEHDGDRWSGHVSLPGGRAEACDADLAATAVREALEEVGVDLATEARLVGRLERFQAIARGRRVDLQITPYVFAAAREVAPRPGPEAEAVFWLPLAAAARGELDDAHEVAHGGITLALPGFRVAGRVVWGMTYRVASRLISIASG